MERKNGGRLWSAVTCYRFVMGRLVNFIRASCETGSKDFCLVMVAL